MVFEFVRVMLFSTDSAEIGVTGVTVILWDSCIAHVTSYDILGAVILVHLRKVYSIKIVDPFFKKSVHLKSVTYINTKQKINFNLMYILTDA